MKPKSNAKLINHVPLHSIMKRISSSKNHLNAIDENISVQYYKIKHCDSFSLIGKKLVGKLGNINIVDADNIKPSKTIVEPAKVPAQPLQPKDQMVDLLAQVEQKISTKTTYRKPRSRLSKPSKPVWNKDLINNNSSVTGDHDSHPNRCRFEPDSNNGNLLTPEGSREARIRSACSIIMFNLTKLNNLGYTYIIPDENLISSNKKQKIICPKVKKPNVKPIPKPNSPKKKKKPVTPQPDSFPSTQYSTLSRRSVPNMVSTARLSRNANIIKRGTTQIEKPQTAPACLESQKISKKLNKMTVNSKANKEKSTKIG